MLLVLQAPLAKPYVILPPSLTVSEPSRARTRVTLEGGVLTFLCRSPAQKVWVEGGINEPMSRVGPDLWELRLRMEGWNRAFFGYGFTTNPDWAFRDHTWRGERAPALPRKDDTLKGRIIEKSLRSAALGESRKLFVYLPPNPPKRNLPAFFMTDGGECERFARVLEPLILARRMRPCALVGVDHGGYRGAIVKGYDSAKDYRTKEYVPGADSVRFRKHLRFFAEEVPVYVARVFGVSIRRTDRAGLGVSDGARFLLALTGERPRIFGTLLPLSPFAPYTGSVSSDWPRVLIAAGRLESPVDRYAASLHRRLPNSSLDLYVAGHDAQLWELAFARLAPRTFPVIR